MFSGKKQKKANICKRIILVEDEWTLPSLVRNSAFHLEVSKPNTRIVCNLNPKEQAAIFIEITKQNTNEVYVDIILASSAHLELVCFMKGPQSCKLNIKSQLLGENSELNIRNIVISSEKEANLAKTLQDHAASYSKSNVQNIAILNNDSNLSLEGLIKVGKNASNSQSSQYSRAILLSKSAYVDISPNLEILNNQVTCNHGAATGKFDPNSIYYMQSRGIPFELTQNMLSIGFVLSAFDNLDNSIWEEIANNISKNMRISLQERSLPI